MSIKLVDTKDITPTIAVIAVNALRPVTSDLWRALPQPDQQRFVERLARFWDVHRHRLAPEVAAAVDACGRAGA